MREVKMPRLSDSMEVGKIIEWKVEEGDEVHVGDILADIESDKATLEFECFHDGVFAKKVHEEGDEVPAGEVIAYLAEEGEEVEEAPAAEEQLAEAEAEQEPEESAAEEEEEAEETEEAEAEAEAPEEAEAEAPEEAEAPKEEKAPAAPAAETEKGRTAISPYARKLAEKHGIDYTNIEGSGPGGRIIARDIEGVREGKPSRREEEAPEARREKPKPEKEINAEPLAKVVAEKYGIDLSSVKGTGRDGRITVADVQAARPKEAEKEKRPSPPDQELPALEVSEDEAEVEEASFRLRTQAQRVTAAKHAIPHFYVTHAPEVTGLLEKKEELKEGFGASITHMVMLACLRTLGDHPKLNRSYDRGKIYNWKGVHLGLAIDTDQGLTVAVLHDAQDMSFQDLVKGTKDLVSKARENRLSAEERRHPTFVITNMGMYDVDEFEAIINPPAPLTLAVASILDQPVVRTGEVLPGKVMRMTLSCDHRIVEGAAAARFMSDLKNALNEPDELLAEVLGG